MSYILVRYSEIGLKGKNRLFFENKLIKNISLVLNLPISQIKLQHKQILITLKSNLINQSVSLLQQAFGIAWIAPITIVKTDINHLIKTAVQLAGRPSSFAIRVSRIHKNLKITSQQVAIKVGEAVRISTKAKVNLNNPELAIYIDLYKEKSYLYTQKIPGPGGLPVATSGKVLSLLSGGFDSIVSSYLMAKRGARVDFLHFHVFPNSDKVLDSKIKLIIDKLKTHTLSGKLFLAPYIPFQMAVLDLPSRFIKQELVVFRRLMVKLAQKLCQEYQYQALVLGDSLGQVASQTIENIVVVDRAVDLPIFRPLIGMDKKEIIDLVKELGLEQTANLKYQDCCSIVSTHPATKANMDKVANLESSINIDELVNKIYESIKIINI